MSSVLNLDPSPVTLISTWHAQSISVCKVLLSTAAGVLGASLPAGDVSSSSSTSAAVALTTELYCSLGISSVCDSVRNSVCDSVYDSVGDMDDCSALVRVMNDCNTLTRDDNSQLHTICEQAEQWQSNGSLAKSGINAASSDRTVLTRYANSPVTGYTGYTALHFLYILNSFYFTCNIKRAT